MTAGPSIAEAGRALWARPPVALVRAVDCDQLQSLAVPKQRSVVCGDVARTAPGIAEPGV